MQRYQSSYGHSCLFSTTCPAPEGAAEVSAARTAMMNCCTLNQLTSMAVHAIPLLFGDLQGCGNALLRCGWEESGIVGIVDAVNSTRECNLFLAGQHNQFDDCRQLYRTFSCFCDHLMNTTSGSLPSLGMQPTVESSNSPTRQAADSPSWCFIEHHVRQ